MSDTTIHLKADAIPADEGLRFVLPVQAVAPFPREKFVRFLAALKVQSKDFGLVPFRLLGSQRYLLDEIEKALAQSITTVYVLKSRQVGISTLLLALDMFWAFQHSGLLGVFMVHREDARDDFRAAIEIFFHETPKSHKIGYVRHNRNLLILKNGSKFRYLIAGTNETKKGGLGRSGAANFVHSTETAFYGDGDALNEFRSQTSNLYPHRLQIYESTANGFNHFEESWQQAKADPTKWTVFIGWWRDERNQLPLDHPFFAKYMPGGMQEALTALERRRVRMVREYYGVEISLQQVAWYRWHLASEKTGDQGLMDQEMPWTDEDAFQATGSNFFTTESLTVCTREARKVMYRSYRYKLTERFENLKLQEVAGRVADQLKVWEEATTHGYYIVGCDPAFGSSDEADRSVVSVWRGHADCMVQVAEFCSNNPSTYQCAWILAHLCGYYGQRWCMPILEITGPGQAVFDELNKVKTMGAEIRPMPGQPTNELRNILGNMKHFLYRRMDSVGGSGMVFQWKTTHDLKMRLMNQFKNGIELGRAVPRSVLLLEEMRRIINDGGSIEAEGRAKDDRVIGAALAYQAWNSYCQPLTKNMGLTRAESEKVDVKGGREPIDRLIVNFLRKQSIAVPT